MATSLVVGGIKLNVFGLEEYRSRGENIPVSVLFSLHGRLRKYKFWTASDFEQNAKVELHWLLNLVNREC
jgi:hypothetical protein